MTKPDSHRGNPILRNYWLLIKFFCHMIEFKICTKLGPFWENRVLTFNLFGNFAFKTTIRISKAWETEEFKFQHWQKLPATNKSNRISVPQFSHPDDFWLDLTSCFLPNPRVHGQWTLNEGIKQRNMKYIFESNVAGKYTSALTKYLGLGCTVFLQAISNTYHTSVLSSRVYLDLRGSNQALTPFWPGQRWSFCFVSLSPTYWSTFFLKWAYSKVSVIRPGRSRLLEFEKKIVLVV